MTSSAIAHTTANDAAPEKPNWSSTGSLETHDDGSHILHWSDWDAGSSSCSSSAATSENRREVFLASLRRCMTSTGFFYLDGSPLEALREELFRVTAAVFASPASERNQILMVDSPHFRGYSPLYEEQTQGKADQRDQIDYGPQVEGRPKAEFAPHRLLGPNQFLPDHVLPGHQSIILQYTRRAQELSDQLTTALELALGAPQNALHQFMKSEQNDSYFRMKTIRYPNARGGGDQGVGAHKDGGWLTLLATTPAKGLQVQLASGDWVDVPHRTGAIIVNAGQQIERVTRGLLVAATHRVFADPTVGERLSAPFFSMPALSKVVRPLPLDSLSPQFRAAFEAAKAARGGDDVKSDVPRGDLWGGEEEPFGKLAWRGITRSHSQVVDRWHRDVVPPTAS
ncbi:Iron/ascorbate family oxidoreductases [Ceraceosorus bombacis]|uniref:Iron/ascorbate family oxidoreductases n=1 Tax=Ceraceosorus bombacis TaxID=401625 RepID=A0A0N7LA72_9BASI|nr:Iron/ascorbate family oxidoreductases [Ceraceosorus bombacis]